MQLEECGAVATLFGQNEADPQILAVVLARLQAATKRAPHCARVRPSVQLEKRFTYEPFTVCHPEVSKGGRAQSRPSSNHVPQMRLLAVREIDVTMRGNRPRRVDARKVVDCAGPWRVDDGWFEEPILRDEYDVLLEDGMLCRIYHQGRRWYLRGAYD
jgi:hypothetical protein